MYERILSVADAGERGNLANFLARIVQLDDSAVVRMRGRGDGRLDVWAATGFDVLAVRSLAGSISPDDTAAGADQLLHVVRNADGSDMDPGFSMDSAWRGALPPIGGFDHVDDVPARVLLDLAQRGATLAEEHGSSHGPPASLLDQDVLSVSGNGYEVGIPMRVVFALGAMGFVPGFGATSDSVDPNETVRVRATATWLRLDARFGSLYRRRGGGLPLSVV
ncbi:hypothetical protein [Rhodococcus sp. NPDC058521]|uniref:hypothetical protein n=1 Tax=Rhodococcus sp. NPDC058521 TaxID=3346536 RepID=UPI00365AC76E